MCGGGAGRDDAPNAHDRRDIYARTTNVSKEEIRAAEWRAISQPLRYESEESVHSRNL